MSSTRANVDRLSLLPEEVLSHRLSLMPTKFAVRTSTLSKNWRYIWTFVTNLDFDDFHPVYGLDCLSNFVDRVLKSCKTSQVNRFQLRFSENGIRTTTGSNSNSIMSKSNVSKWINEAVRLNVCELDIKVAKCGLPLSLFSCKTLTKLSLTGCHKFFQNFIVPSLVILPGLKTLNITVYCKSYVNTLRLIHGCPVLESLSLVMIRMADDIEDYNFNIPTLKRLKLTTTYSSSINKVVLNVPNLEYLFVGGGLSSLFVIQDLPSHATVCFSFNSEPLNHLMVELLKGISGAKLLSWSAPSLHVAVKSPQPKLSNVKYMSLMKGSLCCPWMLDFHNLEEGFSLEYLCIQEPEETCQIEPRSVPSWMLSNLKTMIIKRFKGRNCDMRFIKHVLGNAEVLKTLTIICESIRMRDELRLCAQLLKFPRASRYCKINFVGKWIKS